MLSLCFFAVLAVLPGACFYRRKCVQASATVPLSGKEVPGDSQDMRTGKPMRCLPGKMGNIWDKQAQAEQTPVPDTVENPETEENPKITEKPKLSEEPVVTEAPKEAEDFGRAFYP